MTVFVVTYDLLTPGNNYKDLIDALESTPHCHVQQSVWFINVNNTAVEVVNWLSQFMDQNDKLFVDAVSPNWAGKGMPVCGKWLNDLGL